MTDSPTADTPPSYTPAVPATTSGPAVFSRPAPDVFVAELPGNAGRSGRQESRSMLDLMLRTAEALVRGPVQPHPWPRPSELTLVVVRSLPAGSAEQDAEQLSAQIALAVHGLPFAARVLEDAGAPCRWPDAFGASPVPVHGSGDAVLWSPPDVPEVLVMAGTCRGDSRWSDSLAAVIARHAPDRVAVPALSALGRDASDVARVLRPVPALLVRGLVMEAAVYGPFLDLLVAQQRLASVRARGRHRSGPRRCTSRRRRNTNA